MLRKFVAIATAVTCMVSTVNFTALAASTFADINDVPWVGSVQYIDEAESLGLMSGYAENGSILCKAKNNVTYCEAVQLIYSIMCSNDSTQKVNSTVISKWTSTMQSANIPTWAYDCIAYGLDNSILSANDIKIFVTSGIQNNARREDVAVIFGKALGKFYTINSNATLSYSDKSSISSTSIPYIELLNRLNIMVGDSNNNFNPKVNINRAEMAVISTKAYNKLKNSTPTPASTAEQITNTYYSEFPSVPDFGKITGATQYDKLSLGNGSYEYGYDLSSIDTSSSSSSLKLYDKALTNNGFNIVSGDKNSVMYNNGTLYVVIGVDKERPLFYVDVFYANTASTKYTYYPEFPSVPDFGSIANVPLDSKVTNGNSYLYSYKFGFSDSYIDEYDKILSDNGFTYYDKIEDGILYKKGNLFVSMSLNSRYSTLDITVMYLNL